jgi:hypothetical protein
LFDAVHELRANSGRLLRHVPSLVAASGAFP